MPDPQIEITKPKNSKNIRLFVIILTILLITAGITTYLYLTKNGEEKPELNTENEKTEQKPQSIMILIEYKDTIGLTNFVNEMQKRNIPGLLHLSPEFVTANCETVKELLKYDMEIMASLNGKPFWDLPYDEQKEEILKMKEEVEACTGTPVRIISSPYMASDMTTIEIAEELGIPYVTARGTTDTKATVYEIEGYKTKILSVSNIPAVQFKYGSLCDYSYYERSGTPENMLAELNRAYEPLTSKEEARYGSIHRVTPVSHTNIGGYLRPWTEMWLSFWDQYEGKIEWVGLDEFMSNADWTLPDWQIPINKNAPYTPEKIRPLVPYEEVEKVQNPCRVEDLGKEETKVSETNTQPNAVNSKDKILMFHNGQGPMCLDALEFFDTIDYPVEEFLNHEEGFAAKLNEQKAKFAKSEGVSESFGYYPMIFIKDRAFSGFSEEIKSEILKEIGE